MEFQVLGPVAVIDHGAPADIGGPRQRRLLAALEASANRVVDTDALIEIVFEGDPPAGATATIRTYVARLRKALGDGSGAMIETVPHGYLLRIDDDLIDARRFENDVELGRRQLADNDPLGAATTLRRALDHWQGEAYGAFAGEDWLRGEVARLDELRVDAAGLLVEAQLASGLAEAVIPELRRLIDTNPLRERFRGQLMLALHRTGRHAEALRTFDDYRTELIELGLEPSAELVALERSVAAHDPALQLTAPAGRALRGYRLGASLGAGRQGEVFRAVQPVVGREVAIKVIRAEVADSPAFIRRFDARAQAVSKLEHAHIVPLHDYWREPNAAYLVNRLMPSNLHDRLDTGPLELDDVVTLTRQIGSALFTAHRAGVVHSDVRPSNVLLDADGNFYLSDFRLVDVDLADVEAMPRSGFEAPEVSDWQRPGPASDQYSFAILVAYALTGMLPFGRRGIASPDEHVLSVHTHRPSVPAATDEVLWRAAAWDPDDRYDDVAGFADELISSLGGTERGRADDVPTNPFRGLKPFLEADAPWFFGRDDVIEEALQRLGPDGARLVTVIGPSGCGKSSIVRAGVVPRLRNSALPGSGEWFIASMAPGRHPLAGLRAAVRSIATQDTQPSDTDRSVGEIIRSAMGADRTVLLVIDQMEELYTLTPPDERSAFIDGLTDVLANDRARLRVVATLRADFHDRPLRHSRFGRFLADGAVAVVGMSVAQLDQAIREPAARAGVEVEPTLASELITELVDQAAALPLLQFTLTELFDHRAGRLMTLDAYRALGGVDTAVADRAEAVFGDQPTSGQASARRLFLRLVSIDERGRASRRRVARAELASLTEADREVDRLVDAFGTARLLTFDRDPTSREPTVEIAHESLMAHWPRLQRWVLEAGDGLRTQSKLTEATGQWFDSDRDDGDLYRGGRLEAAVAWAGDHEGSLTPDEVAFLRASVDARDAAERAQRAHVEQQARSNRRLRVLATGVAIALVVALTAGVLAIRQRDRADRQAQRAEARELIADSNANLTFDPELSVLLAIQGINRSDDEVLPEAERALHLAVLENRVLGSVPSGSEAFAAFAPDGRSFVASGEDPLAPQVWSVETQESILALEGHDTTVTSAAFDPTGRRIVTTSSTGPIKLWDARSGEVLADFGETGLPMMQGAFSHDGSLMAVSGHDRTRIWDVATGDVLLGLGSLFENRALMWGVAFSPDDSMLATGESNAEGFAAVAIWDVESGRLVRRLDGHTEGVTDVEFSPDGTRLFSGSIDGTVKMWSVGTGELLGTFTGHGAGVRSLDVSADGRWLASAGGDKALIWSPNDFTVRAELSGHSGLNSIDFAPDGATVLTASSPEGTTRWWNVAPTWRSELVSIPGVETGTVTSTEMGGAVTFDSDGGRLVASLGDELVVRDMPSGRELVVIATPGARVRSVRFDPAGSRLIVADDGGVSVHDATTGDLIGRPIAGTFGAGGSLYPDDDRVVAAGPGVIVYHLDSGYRTSVVSRWLWTFDAVLDPTAERLAVADTAESTLLPERASADGFVEVLDAETFDVLATVAVGPTSEHHTDQVVALAYSADGMLFGTASKDGSAIIWDAETIEPIARLDGHAGALTAIAFDAGGTAVATASLDRTVRVWDARSGAARLTLPNDQAVLDVAFTPDGRYLAASEPTGQVTVYMMDTDELVAEAQRRLTRGLTDAECLRYLHTQTCPTA